MLLSLLLAATAWGWPLPGVPVVERGFSPPATAYGVGHRGVDLSAELGDPVLAAGPGRVTYSGRLAGRGVVTVTHEGGLRTTYEPVELRIRLGTAVGRGAVLGEVGSGHAACRSATCLHWGLLRGDTYLDPLALLQAGPVRLLPVGAPPAVPRTAPARASGGSAAPPPPSPRPAGRGTPVDAALVAGAGLAGVAALRRWPGLRRR